jgi:hypothetical protein
LIDHFVKKQILEVTDTGRMQQPLHCFILSIFLVVIYDACNHQFNFADDLEYIDSVLPHFDGEIPAGSFAAVAYTMSTYKKASNFHLNTNIQFVILLDDYK